MLPGLCRPCRLCRGEFWGAAKADTARVERRAFTNWLGDSICSQKIWVEECQNGEECVGFSSWEASDEGKEEESLGHGKCRLCCHQGKGQAARLLKARPGIASHFRCFPLTMQLRTLRAFWQLYYQLTFRSHKFTAKSDLVHTRCLSSSFFFSSF